VPRAGEEARRATAGHTPHGPTVRPRFLPFVRHTTAGVVTRRHASK
jgi:hypothetical protein